MEIIGKHKVCRGDALMHKAAAMQIRYEEDHH